MKVETFTIEQFQEMTKSLRIELIKNCIETIIEGGSIEINETRFNDIYGFLGWVLDNV